MFGILSTLKFAKMKECTFLLPALVHLQLDIYIYIIPGKELPISAAHTTLGWIAVAIIDLYYKS